MAVTIELKNRLDVAERLVAAGETGQASLVLAEVFAADPNLARAHSLLGLCHLRHGDTVLAESSFAVALEIDPRDELGHLGTGLILEELREDIPRARRAYQRALNINPALTIARKRIERLGPPRHRLPTRRVGAPTGARRPTESPAARTLRRRLARPGPASQPVARTAAPAAKKSEVGTARRVLQILFVLALLWSAFMAATWTAKYYFDSALLFGYGPGGFLHLGIIYYVVFVGSIAGLAATMRRW